MNIDFGVPYWDYQSGVIGKGGITKGITLEEFETQLAEDAYNTFLDEHSNDPLIKEGEKRTEGFTPIENALADYAKTLMGYAYSFDENKDIFNALDKKLDEDEFGGWNIFPWDPTGTGKPSAGAFGTFIQNKFFGMEKLGIPSNLPGPDFGPAEYGINKITDQKVQQGIEIKTRFANIESPSAASSRIDEWARDLNIHVGNMTAKTDFYIPSEDVANFANSIDFTNLKNRFTDANLLQKIALYKIIMKMQNFLYLRITLSKTLRGNAISKILAMILFMRLIADKLIELINNEKAPFRISITAKTTARETGRAKPSPSGKGTYSEMISSTTYSIELKSNPIFEQTSGAERLLSKFRKELELIRTMYQKEHDFINQLEKDNWKTARMFYYAIKHVEAGSFTFRRLE